MTASDKASSLSRRVLAAVLERGMTQSELAAKLGVDRSHISRVKSGEHEFTDAQLERIERVTKVPLPLLMLGEPPAGASAEVRQIYREALELLSEAEAVRRKLNAGLAAPSRARRQRALAAH
jgi:transcriptional regulator with XRE-family HTH domain